MREVAKAHFGCDGPATPQTGVVANHCCLTFAQWNDRPGHILHVLGHWMITRSALLAYGGTDLTASCGCANGCLCLSSLTCVPTKLLVPHGPHWPRPRPAWGGSIWQPCFESNSWQSIRVKANSMAMWKSGNKHKELDRDSWQHLSFGAPGPRHTCVKTCNTGTKQQPPHPKVQCSCFVSTASLPVLRALQSHVPVIGTATILRCGN